MKLVTFDMPGHGPKVGAMVGDQVADISANFASMSDVIAPGGLARAQAAVG